MLRKPQPPIYWAAALVVLIAASLALAETTGVTNLTATVIRIVRGDGTLVVEVDDPNIQVLVDGEELVISGAGPKEIRLRPGNHELHTLKDGKPVETKLITITKGGRDVVKVAREEPIAAVASGPTARLVWADASDGVPSPDGNYIAYRDLQSGDLAVRELATGKNRRLTNQGRPELALHPVFSPDSQQVAYSWMNKDQVNELRLIGLDGSEPRVLYPNNEREFRSLAAYDWSADGKYILAQFTNRDTNRLMRHMVLVSVVDGSVRTLKTLDSVPGKMSLSPDGRFIAYSLVQERTLGKHDIYVLAIDGSGENSLVEHPADDVVLGWAPDGNRLVFASDRIGSRGIWLIAVADGKPDGSARLMQPEMGQFRPLGLTRNGSFYYGLSSGRWNVYTATLDLEKGQLLSPPAEAMQHGEGLNWAPAWSPDGRYLACVSHPPGSTPFFYIQLVASKEVRKLAPNLKSIHLFQLHWSPDGRALLCAGMNHDGKYEALRVDVQTGAVTTLLANDSADGRSAPFDPRLSPDGKVLFYKRYGKDRLQRVLRQNREEGVEQELYQASDRSFQSLALSPDGQQLAFTERGNLKILPAGGGELRELMKGEGSEVSPVAWTPDGRHLLFQRQVPGNPAGKASSTELWRVPAAGGAPLKLDVSLPSMPDLRIHPDGRQIAFSAHSRETDKSEIWALENFLPPLDDSKRAATTPHSTTKSAGNP